MTLCLLSAADVLRAVGAVLLALLILLAMVTVHEFGHYAAGKLLHFKVEEFSVGAGFAPSRGRTPTPPTPPPSPTSRPGSASSCCWRGR